MVISDRQMGHPQLAAKFGALSCRLMHSCSAMDRHMQHAVFHTIAFLAFSCLAFSASPATDRRTELRSAGLCTRELHGDEIWYPSVPIKCVPIPITDFTLFNFYLLFKQLHVIIDTSVTGWLGSRVVSVLDSGAEGPGLKSQPRRCRVTVLGKLFTPIVPLFTKQQNW